MSLERTLSIVKPDGVRKNVIGDVYHRFEKAGLRIVAARMMQLTQAQAEAFYGIHRERTFFKDRVSHMNSGPVVVPRLEGGSDIPGGFDECLHLVRALFLDREEAGVLDGNSGAVRERGAGRARPERGPGRARRRGGSR